MAKAPDRPQRYYLIPLLTAILLAMGGALVNGRFVAAEFTEDVKETTAAIAALASDCVDHKVSADSHPVLVQAKDTLKNDIDKLGVSVTKGFEAMNSRLDLLFIEVAKP